MIRAASCAVGGNGREVCDVRGWSNVLLTASIVGRRDQTRVTLETHYVWTIVESPHH
jgi:hypothetical protein